MPKITFVKDKMTIEVSQGTSLQDAVDQAGATLPFNCRVGSCGTCRCVVVSGADHLNEQTDAEIELFDMLTSVGLNERLACQCIVNGDVVIQA